MVTRLEKLVEDHIPRNDMAAPESIINVDTRPGPVIEHVYIPRTTVSELH